MKHAVIIGAGFSGLCVAKAISNAFDEITLVERDVVSKQASRHGVPQSVHSHVLLGRGQEALDRLFPDFLNDSIAAGCPEIQWGPESGTFGKFGWLKNVPFGFSSVQSSRFFLEERLRSYISKLPNMKILEGTTAVDLVLNRNHLQGVTISRLGHKEPENLMTEFVFDCSGRSSRLSEWLTLYNYGPVSTKVVNARLVYGSQLYKVASEQKLDQKFIYIGLDPERRLRAGALLAVENGNFMVTLAGALGEKPPTDQSAFLGYAKSLCQPHIYDAMAAGTPVGPIARFARTENRRIEMQKIHKWPKGLLALGDSITANNPVYGQGMSIAAMQAEYLMKAFDKKILPLDLALQKKISAIADWPWKISTGQDLAILRAEKRFKEKSPGSVKSRMSSFLFRKLAMGVIKSDKLSSVYSNIIHLRSRPIILFRPDILLQLLCVRYPKSIEERAALQSDL